MAVPSDFLKRNVHADARDKPMASPEPDEHRISLSSAPVQPAARIQRFRFGRLAVCA